MEYQRIINLLDNTPNQSSKFRTRIWVKQIINYVESIKIRNLSLKLQC